MKRILMQSMLAAAVLAAASAVALPDGLPDRTEPILGPTPLLPNPDVTVPEEEIQFLSDASLLKELHAFDMLETQKAALADTTSYSDKVKTFAKRRVRDLNDADRLVRSTAEQMAIGLETVLPPDKESELEQLRSQTPSSFDRLFLETALSQTEAAIMHLDQAEKNELGTRALYHQMMPMLREHAAEAKRLQERMAKAGSP